jgi:hypothetical protein
MLRGGRGPGRVAPAPERREIPMATVIKPSLSFQYLKDRFQAYRNKDRAIPVGFTRPVDYAMLSFPGTSGRQFGPFTDENLMLQLRAYHQIERLDRNFDRYGVGFTDIQRVAAAVAPGLATTGMRPAVARRTQRNAASRAPMLFDEEIEEYVRVRYLQDIYAQAAPTLPHSTGTQLELEMAQAAAARRYLREHYRGVPDNQTFNQQVAAAVERIRAEPEGGPGRRFVETNMLERMGKPGL